MRYKRFRAIAAAGVLAAAFGVSGAQATTIGGTVSNSDFTAANGSLAGWAYVGQTTPAFTLPGSGTVELRVSEFPDSFGYSTTNHASLTQVFSSAAGVGATATINPGFSPFLFYFNTNPQGAGNDATRFTDGFSTGSAASQAGIDIFYQASSNTYSFFFDDGGPLGRDDNDFNDLVINYTPTARPPAVPEPASVALLGASLFGVGLMRRFKGRSIG